jgi:asparagine synthase (glutamine-hydrolysing)
MRGILPDATIDRPKRGFGVPVSHWFRGDLGNFVRDLLLGETCTRRGIFQPDYVAKLIAMNEGGRNLDMQLWTLVSFEMWCRIYLDGGARRRISSTVAPDPRCVRVAAVAS